MCNDNIDPFAATLHNVLLVSDLWDRLFLIITLMNLGHTCLFKKGGFTAYFSDKKKNVVTLLHSAHRKHAFLVKTKENFKSKKVTPRKKVALELSHQRLGHRSNRSLMSVDTAFFWQDIGLRIESDPFCTSWQISSMNKRARPKTPLKPKTPFKWVFIDICPETSPKRLTSETTFSKLSFDF